MNKSTNVGGKEREELQAGEWKLDGKPLSIETIHAGR